MQKERKFFLSLFLESSEGDTIIASSINRQKRGAAMEYCKTGKVYKLMEDKLAMAYC